MKSTFFGFLFILVSTIACSGGRNSANRAGFCFNNEESGKYDPLTLDYKNDNFRKAVFNLKAPNDLNPQEPVANEEEVVNFTLPTYGSGGLKNEANQSEEEFKKQQKERQKELSKVYPLQVGAYEYIESEIFFSKELPQVQGRNNYQRIHVVHLKDDKGKHIFANKCVSNMPYNDSIPPLKVNTLLGFEVTENGQILTDKLGTFTVEYKDWKIERNFSDNEKNLPNSPKDFFEKSDVNYQLFKVYNARGMKYTHELRTLSKVDGYDVYVTIRYHYISPEILKQREEAKKKAQAH